MNKLMKAILIFSASGFVFACASAPPPPPPKPVVKAKASTKVLDYAVLAATQVAAKEFDKAIDSYAKALEKNSGNLGALYNRGTLLYRVGKVDAALADFQKVVELDDKHRDGALNLGVCFRDKGDLAAAIKVYRNYLKTDSFNARILNNLSALYRKQKKFKKAISSIRTLLMRDQKNVDAYKNLALIYFDQGKLKLSMTILHNALKMSTEQKRKDPDIHVNMGMIYLAKKENGKAMAQFKHAVGLDKNHLLANYNIGALALAHRDYSMAAKTLQIAYVSLANDFEVNAALGYALQGQQKHAEAAAQLEKAYAIKKDENVLYQLVVVWQAAGDANKALAYGEQLLALQGKQCTEEDFDGFCGRYNGIKMMIAMEKEDAAPPPEEEKAKPKLGQVDVFAEGGDEEDEQDNESTASDGSGAPAGTGDGAGVGSPNNEGKAESDAVKTATVGASGSS